MISKTGEAETITTHYLFFLGLYRALYLINWIWRFYFEGFFDMIAVVAGVVQTILYCDFFYLYVTKGKRLPEFRARPSKKPARYQTSWAGFPSMCLVWFFPDAWTWIEIYIELLKVTKKRMSSCINGHHVNRYMGERGGMKWRYCCSFESLICLSCCW